VLIVFFTFFYTLIQFNPEKIADSIQKRGWYIPWMRPGSETVKYINWVLMHLCLWWWIGLWFLGIYSYIINDLPFMQWLLQEFGSVPVIVTGSGVIIIIGVVQELINKLSSDVIMQKYEDQI
jgi:preprotein translocase subunit SecY